MEQDPDPNRLRALEDRIEKLKGKGPVKRAPTGVVFSQGETRQLAAGWRLALGWMFCSERAPFSW